eukprot:CAMPEP_0202978906 /NCGR_PEP_ID=MMETSP1396-20130829/85195_1 /ASSEMBLY_ACC=CAM_ASM_000872 /TAXON_ID= /ORGANISM="Pseudokeronopsis sp., Strain Brazil" /LENGTH=107 /DNA_ID=CAMNT_0049718079 /DNA_START=690 /DNA_END=1014 /DNA_ORIENTATION=-
MACESPMEPKNVFWRFMGCASPKMGSSLPEGALLPSDGTKERILEVYGLPSPKMGSSLPEGALLPPSAHEFWFFIVLELKFCFSSMYNYAVMGTLGIISFRTGSDGI